MESKYSTISHENLTKILQSSSYPYLPEQAPRAAYMEPDSVRASHDHFLDYDMNGAMQREVEKRRIREEIIMSEIVRRRVLEAEVRRELMIEREIAYRRSNSDFLFGSSQLMGFESLVRPPFLETRNERNPQEEIIPFSLEERLRLHNVRRESGLECLPFQRAVSDDNLRISEINKPVLAKGKEKEKIFLQAKPEKTISGSKRKSVTAPEEDNSELPSDVTLKKKAKNEWNCAICQISATSEQGLKEHVRGKKHKSKETAVKAQQDGKNYIIGLSTKGAIVPEDKMKTETEFFMLKKSGEASSKMNDLSQLKENPNEIEVQEVIQSFPKETKPKEMAEVVVSRDTNAKPEATTISGSKRKTITQPRENYSEPPLDVILKKNVKNEWNCTPCLISTVGEQVLKEHVQGNMYKSKEAAYKVKRAGKNYSIVLFSKQETNPEDQIKIGTESLMSKKSVDASSKIIDVLKLHEENLNEVQVVQEVVDESLGEAGLEDNMPVVEDHDLVGESKAKDGGDSEITKVDETKGAADVFGMVGLTEQHDGSTNNVVEAEEDLLNALLSKDNKPMLADHELLLGERKAVDFWDFEITEVAKSQRPWWLMFSEPLV